ncbi:hypothetical protein [Thermoanaerobacterium thermosaccharolyticum]|uniref:hypothetical protein n=1 Tax=Thermoanaerobacterium thermosaccharolyticum TaxID=1517 RepID=UPI002FDB3DE8
MVVLSKMDKVLKKKLIKIAETLPDEKIKEIINSIEEYLKNKNVKEMIEEDREWLNSNLTDFPEFDWGPEGPPKGKPVKYIECVGIVVEK